MNLVEEIKEKLGGELRENEMLAPYTTFKIGGPARYFYVAENDDDFIKAVALANKTEMPTFILGGGSNILVSDKGFRGLVIKKKNGILPLDFRVEGTKIVADARVKLGALVQAATEGGLTGLEWAAGIPGSVGGAIRGNAGAYGGQMSDVVESINGVCNFRNGKKEFLENKDLGFSYRQSVFKKSHKHCVILSVVLALRKGDKEEIKEKTAAVLGRRNRSTTPQFPCAGCIFKNPVVSDDELLKRFEKDSGQESADNKVPAGYLIDRLGLKGKKIGGAMISDKNANFIVNVDNATANDVIILISFIKQQVRDKFGIQLEEEIEFLGF